VQYQNIVNVEGNELFSAGAYRMVNGAKVLMTEAVTVNILSDYKDGVMPATQEMVACLDYYNENGEVAKSIEAGELLRVGHLVRIDADDNGTPILAMADGSPRIFRIKSRRFTYNGRPLLALAYQEIKG
jgi:hypothetical protein